MASDWTCRRAARGGLTEGNRQGAKVAKVAKKKRRPPAFEQDKRSLFRGCPSSRIPRNREVSVRVHRTDPVWIVEGGPVRERAIAAVVLALLCLCGCGRKPAAVDVADREPPSAPEPPEAVNCVLEEHCLYPERAAGGDVLAVARFKRAKEYARARRGQWDYSWRLVAYDIIKVERGTWAENQLIFVSYDRHPAPGSGLLVSMVRWPFYKSTVYAFALDTSKSPARVVGIERRSRLAPHGPAVRRSVDEKTLRRVTDAAWKFLGERVQVGGGGSGIAEETDDLYVVEINAEHLGASDTWVLAVDKKTLAGKFVPEIETK